MIIAAVRAIGLAAAFCACCIDTITMVKVDLGR